MNCKTKLVSRWNAAGIVMILAASVLLLPRLQAQERSAANDGMVEAILKARVSQRQAHLLADASLLASAMGPGFREVNRGSSTTPSAEQMQRQFARYFASTRFLEWEDVTVPTVVISPTGDWGEVVVEKRVRTIPADSSGEESSVRYAWTERWTRTGDRWALSTLTSTDRHDPDSAAVPLADRVRAWNVLRAARRSTGGDEAVAKTEMLRFVADCQGPRSSFRTTVLSARDGRALFFQEFPNRPRYRAGISLQGKWEESDGKLVDSLGAIAESVLRGHELLLLAISPEARYSSPVARADETFDGKTAQIVRFRDALGAPVDFVYEKATGRPLAFRPINQTGQGARDLVIRFDDWRPSGRLTLPRSVTMTQGSDVYRFRLTEISTEWIEDRAFRPN